MNLKAINGAAPIAAVPCLVRLTLRLLSLSKTLLNVNLLVASIRVGCQFAAQQSEKARKPAWLLAIAVDFSRLL